MTHSGFEGARIMESVLKPRTQGTNVIKQSNAFKSGQSNIGVSGGFNDWKS